MASPNHNPKLPIFLSISYPSRFPPPAVPGPADSLASRCCHRLIRDGARLAETVDDILEELGPLVREVPTAPDEPPVRHTAELALTDHTRVPMLGTSGKWEVLRFTANMLIILTICSP